MAINKPKKHKRRHHRRAKPKMMPQIPLMNPYGNLQASTVTYTPDNMVPKDMTPPTKPSQPSDSITGNTPRPIFPNQTMISGEYSRPFTGSNLDPTSSSNGKKPCVLADDPNCEKGSEALDKFNAFVSKHGAEAACMYFAKNPILGMSIAPYCGQIGAFLGQYIAKPLKKAEETVLEWDGKLNQWVYQAGKDVWGGVKEAAKDIYCGGVGLGGLWTPPGC